MMIWPRPHGQLAAKLVERSQAVLALGKKAFYEQLEMPLEQAYRHTSKVIVDNMMMKRCPRRHRRVPGETQTGMDRRMTGLEPRISIVTLGVDDMKRARAFYERLGWSAAASSSDDVTFFNHGRHDPGPVWPQRHWLKMPRSRYLRARSTNASLAHNCESEDRVDAVMAFAEKLPGRRSSNRRKRRSGVAIRGIFRTRTGICGKLPTTLSFHWIKTDGLLLHEPRQLRSRLYSPGAG